MKKNLLNFSSISPIQMIGKKKDYYRYDPSHNLFDNELHKIVDTKITKALKSNVPNLLAGLTFPISVGFLGFKLGEFLMENATQEIFNPTFQTTACFLMFGIVMSIGEIKINQYQKNHSEEAYNNNYYFLFPISSSIYNVTLNSLLYPILLPARLIAKAKMHNELKLTRTEEGRNAINNKYRLPMELKNQKHQLKQNKIENNLLKKANKELESQQGLYKSLKKFEETNLKLRTENAELRDKNEQIKKTITEKEL